MNAELIALLLQLGRGSFAIMPKLEPEPEPEPICPAALEAEYALHRARMTKMQRDTKRLAEARIIYERAQKAADIARQEYTRVFCETNPKGCEEAYGPK